MSTVSEPTFEQLALIIQEQFGIPRDQIGPDVTLRDIEVDSLALIEVALIAEVRFGTQAIPTEDISSDSTVQSFYEVVLAAVTANRA